jgi:TonB family protein
MRPRPLILALVLSLVSLFALPASAQQAEKDGQQSAPQTESQRKVVNRVTPMYPNIARTMDLHGVVKVQVMVGPNGAPKSVQVKGGHPILAEAAVNAVEKWKWVATGHETRELIEVRFEQ